MLGSFQAAVLLLVNVCWQTGAMFGVFWSSAAPSNSANRTGARACSEPKVMHATCVRYSTGFKILHANIATGAFHDSGERFNPPKNHPNTRLS